MSAATCMRTQAMMTWRPISTLPPPLVRVLVWCRGEAFTAFRCENGDWCTDPEPTIHPLDGAYYPFLQSAKDCGITHWAEIQPPPS